ncbi:hypothetical protein [Nonomuraea zeae]|uniref:hypothetical protein n=1 Tax=Nonomuraea zeae TaxID=1642303 RepID=UPI0014788D81|nr:hypothetical protein [Nonomuraea zeae]
MTRKHVLVATLAAGLMFTTVPASATAYQANEKAAFTLSQTSGPKGGKLVVGYAVVWAKDLENTALVEKKTKAVHTRLPFKKSFTVKQDTCVIVAVAEGKKGVRLRLNVTVDGAAVSSKRGKAPYYVHCNV